VATALQPIFNPPVNTTQTGVVDGLITYSTHHQACSGVFSMKQMGQFDQSHAAH